MSPERWQILRVATGDTLLHRDGAVLRLRERSCALECPTVSIVRDSVSNVARARIDSLYFAMQRHYAPFSEMLSFRIRLTKFIVVLWILQLVAAVLAIPLLRRWVSSPAVLVSAAAIAGWLLVTWLLHSAYLP